MSTIVPTQLQVPVLYVIVVYAVMIFAIWNIPTIRNLINPFKLFTIGWHELCHIVAAIMTGGTILKVTIDPNVGGCTIVEGGHPPSILAAGYIGSSIFGGLLIMAGFDTLVSKIMSFVIGIGMICPLAVVRDKLTLVLTMLFEGMLIGFWFIDHASALRWYCLFLGVMNVFYVVWDVADDKFFRKANDSDCTQFSIMYPRISAHLWATLWILFDVGVLIGFVFIGIAAFKRTDDQMAYEAGMTSSQTYDFSYTVLGLHRIVITRCSSPYHSLPDIIPVFLTYVPGFFIRVILHLRDITIGCTHTFGFKSSFLGYGKTLLVNLQRPHSAHTSRYTIFRQRPPPSVHQPCPFFGRGCRNLLIEATFQPTGILRRDMFGESGRHHMGETRETRIVFTMTGSSCIFRNSCSNAV